MQPISVYIHIPFCSHRCAYCDFNTYAGISDLIPSYIQALCLEISALAQSASQRLPVHTVFFGGGTPSLIPIDLLEKVIGSLDVSYDLAGAVEITLEANPGTLSQEYLFRLRAAGVDRLSLGMQSALAEELRFLEREHDYLAVIQSVKWARKAGFENLNLDLIFGLPEQLLGSWQRSLKMAADLNPEHLSIYSLSLEHGTPMSNWAERGLISQPDPDMAADMYDWAYEFLEGKGYSQYEISNWAAWSGQQELLSCRHNLQYWHLDSYLGFGAGAHGFIAGFHTANVLSPAQYIQRLTTAGDDRPMEIFPRTHATVAAHRIDRQTEMGEMMMMGLRLTREGVSNKRFAERFGTNIQDEFGSRVEYLVNNGLLEWAGKNHDTLRLTWRGRLLGNRVFMEFV
jgi:oxygen-independent coproporphyrinogen-3 oxidase